MIPVCVPRDDLDSETRASACYGIQAVQGGASLRESHENRFRFKVAHRWTLIPVKMR